MTLQPVPEFQHRTVLLDEAVDGLALDGARADGIYVDGTFGRGGHSRKILRRLGLQGRLIAFDKDPQAIEAANVLAAEDACDAPLRRNGASQAWMVSCWTSAFLRHRSMTQSEVSAFAKMARSTCA
jgi:hypothetical protein